MDAIIKDRPHAHRSSALRKRRLDECSEQRQDLPAGPWSSKPETVAEASDGSPPFAFYEMKRELAETERNEKDTAWKTKAEKRKMLMDSDENEVLKRIKILLTVVERGKVLERLSSLSLLSSSPPPSPPPPPPPKIVAKHNAACIISATSTSREVSHSLMKKHTAPKPVSPAQPPGSSHDSDGTRSDMTHLHR